MVGFDPESFWDQTERTLAIAMHAKAQAWRHEHNARLWHTWHAAAFQRAKKLPPLKRLLLRDKPRVQSWQEQLAIMTNWASAHNAREAKKHG